MNLEKIIMIVIEITKYTEVWIVFTWDTHTHTTLLYSVVEAVDSCAQQVVFNFDRGQDKWASLWQFLWYMNA